MQIITGNTYPVRAELRALGGKWNPDAKAWEMPDDKADQARAIVAAAGPAVPLYQRSNYARRRSRYGSTYTRFSSGAEVYTNKRGRCIDAPCCGCCS